MTQEKTLRVQTVLNEELAGNELAPLASFELADAAVQGQRRGEIVLQGVIAGPSAAALSRFLETVLHYPATHWTIDMKNLPVLSLGGLYHLARFVKKLHSRGMVLEVCGIHRHVYMTMKNLNLVYLFAWAD